MAARTVAMSTTKDAAADRRKKLAAQLLLGEIRSLSQQGDGEVEITVPECKLFQSELAAMNLFTFE